MTRYVARLAYDGTAYNGFQRQPEHIPTIQLAVEQAISMVTRQAVSIIGAGRTDTGVHALGQVIAFDVDWKHTDTDLLLAINSQLPFDIALQDIRQYEGFHPRYDALSRQYVYRVAQVTARNPLLNRQVWQIQSQSLDIDRMQIAAQQLIGMHDFGAFGTPPQEGSTNTVREVYLSQWRLIRGDYGDIFTYRIRATAFLYHMVRRIVGTLVQVGLSKLTIDEFKAILASRDIQQAKILAPSRGLVLEIVEYPQHKTATSIATETSESITEYPLEEEKMKQRIQTTFTTTPDVIERRWWVVDAEGVTLGRLASKIAPILRGKHKPYYTPNLDTGDYVIIVNADKIHVTGNRMDQKKYYSYSGYPSGLSTITLREMKKKFPTRPVKYAIKGMLPKGVLGRDMLGKLKVYAGADHPHEAQQPEVLEL